MLFLIKYNNTYLLSNFLKFNKFYCSLPIFIFLFHIFFHYFHHLEIETKRQTKSFKRQTKSFKKQTKSFKRQNKNTNSSGNLDVW